ncbi:hypothetical protein FN976_07915 [Caenimonas sedimenti]|uniref:Uncharacterized protein n=1 Tax=Caenimonas sedimenti TaxID=2596921 RepID=A0A562ZU95_9BURK|nr:hypothetical protein [Caenimonas sedimenti]TWO71908.1 hypothetical protein FN976_07915 [Caenimonas sedimenti]
MFNFDQAKKTRIDIEAKIVSLTTDLQACRAERQAIFGGPAARADVKAMLSKWIDAKAAAFPGALRGRLASFIQTPSTLLNERLVRQEIALPDVDTVLCAALGDQLKVALAKAVDEIVEWPVGPPGLPLAQRGAAVDKVDEKIAALDAERNDLIERARDAGLMLDV